MTDVEVDDADAALFDAAAGNDEPGLFHSRSGELRAPKRRTHGRSASYERSLHDTWTSDDRNDFLATFALQTELAPLEEDPQEREPLAPLPIERPAVRSHAQTAPGALANKGFVLPPALGQRSGRSLSNGLSRKFGFESMACASVCVFVLEEVV